MLYPKSRMNSEAQYFKPTWTRSHEIALEKNGNFNMLKSMTTGENSNLNSNLTLIKIVSYDRKLQSK